MTTKKPGEGVSLGSSASGPLEASQRHRGAHRWVLVLLAIAASGLVAPPPAMAQAVAGYSEYYIPGDEDTLGAVLCAYGATACPANYHTHAVIAVTAWTDTTTVYYDHWEDGYGFDPNTPATADETYMLDAGVLRTFETANIALPTSPTASCAPVGTCPYDGRDRIYVAGGAVTVTRVGWIEERGVGIQGLAWEIYPLAPQLTTYIVPFGETSGWYGFQRVTALIQATSDNTQVTIDLDHDGTPDMLDQNRDGDILDPGDTAVVMLDAGQSFRLDDVSANVAAGTLSSGAIITGSDTLQVKYITGRTNVNNCTRGFSAFPRGFWTRDYYAPLNQPGADTNGQQSDTDYYLYNPNPAAITINWTGRSTSGTFNIPATSVVSFRTASGTAVPLDSGLYFNGSDVFWGVGSSDANGGGGTRGYAHEWGYSLLPTTLLYTEHYLGWAPNGLPLAAGTDDMGVFLTVTQDNTRVFVDFDNNGTTDQTFTLERLQTQFVSDPDGDMSGSHIWATGEFSLAYGQNSATSGNSSPALDLGYVALPATDFVSLVLGVDKSVSPVVMSTASGSTAAFTIDVNTRNYPVDAVAVVDTLPPSFAYVAGSALITLPDLTTVSGGSADPTISGAGTALNPFILTWPTTLLGSMLPNQRITIAYTAQTTAVLAAGTLSQNRVRATGTRTFFGVTQTFNATDFTYNVSGDLLIAKTSSAVNPLSPGDSFSYTTTVTNPAGSPTQTGVSLYDALPAGVTISGATTLNRSSVADTFQASAYNTNNGTRNWNANWVDSQDANPAGGDIQILNGQLRLTGTRNIYRQANLAGATSAVLTFSYGTSGNVDNTDTATVEVGGSLATATTVALTFVNDQAGTVSFVMPAGALSATTTVRIRTNNYSTAAPEYLFIDNLSITYDVAVAGGSLPDILSASALYALAGGQSLTATFTVTVDDPFPPGQDSITNTASTTTTQLPIAISASVTNTVLVPGGGSGTVGDRVWLDTDADGVFDPGETGLAGVEVTLRDLFGTPVQVTTTDSQGRYAFIDVPVGNGYYVQITSGLPSGLTQTTDTVGDAFDINAVFTGNNGTLNWLTNWTENNDNANAATGDIKIVNNRIEFGGPGLTVEANDSIQRSASVVGATSIEVQYSWSTLGIDADDDTLVEYSSNGGASFTPLRRLDNGAENGPGSYTDTIAWLPTNATIVLRFRAEDAIEADEVGSVDNVQLRFPQNQRTASFNLAAGQNYMQADLGYRASPGTAAIGDLVWVDANDDLTRNPGEVGLAGITVLLYQDTDGDGLPDGAPIGTTVTGPGGAYLFTGLPANGVLDYVVTLDTGQAPLAGYSATTNTLFSYPNLPSGAVRVDADFGFQNPSSTFTIADGVWLDNGLPSGTASNGVKDGSEVGIGGVTVDLLDSAGNTIASTTSASDGSFQFTGVPGGQNYRWRITDDASVLADYYGTTASALSGNFQMTGSLTTSLDFTANPHFGYNQTRTIGDTVWNDNGAGGGTLGNGTQDGTEPGLSGVTVLLYRDVNNNGVFEPGGADGAAVATQVTDAAGHYLFAGLPTGSRWFVSIDNTQAALAGFDTLTTGDFDLVAPGHQRQVTPILTGGANRLDIDYGYRTTTPFTLSGRFFSDINRNGVDNAEPGFAGVTLQLRNSSGVVIGTTSTVVGGGYSFVGLPAGTYTLQVTDTSGVLAGYETTFERTELGLAASYNGQETVTLGPDTSDVHFGYYRGNSIVTRAVISSFAAYDVAGAVALEWRTASELGTVGFYVKRWDEREAQYVAVNEKLLPSLISAPQGGVYRYIDPQAVPGERYQYALVEVEASGARLGYGPYEVDTRQATTDAEAEAALADELLREQGYSRTPHREQAEVLRARGEAATLDLARAAASRSSAQATKIGVAENGIYYVSLQDLQAQAGVRAPQALSSLTNRGRSVAFSPSADRGGILFYGRGPTSNVERDNVYRLSNEADSVLMQTRANPNVPPPSGAEAFIKRLHVEQDAIAANNVYSDPDGDFWVWDYVYAGLGAKSFVFRTDGAAQLDGASLTVRLKGGTETPADPDHHATFALNGNAIGEAFWKGTEALETTLAFDGSLLVDGENTLTIDGLTDTEAPYSLFYVESFDVYYTSYYRAHGNKLESPASGNAAVLISGFTRPDVTVFDITVPTRPEIVLAPVARLGDGTYGVVVASNNPQAVYYAVAPDALLGASRILPDKPSTLRQADNQGEYLLVTTEALEQTAQTLADYRSDLSSQVVDIEDVYDEFNHGIASPYALRAFLAYARAKWQTPPRYVVLAGDGTYDYKNVQGFGDNAIPPMMANTPAGLFPSDTWFIPLEKAAQPELAIGRLPVSTTDELAEVLRKIEARESALGEPWVRSTLLVADDPDSGGDFALSSEGVASLVPGDAPLVRAYISIDGPANVRSALLAGLNQGTGVVSYFGHAGFGQLADEALLTSADAATLVNADRPTVMTAMTCLAGSAALPGYSAIGEILVRQQGAGAVALWAPSGMSENELAGPLAEGFYAALFNGRSERLGDAVKAARRAYKANSLPPYMLSIYNLLGDPALRVH